MTVGSSSDGDHEQFEFLSGLSERKVNEVLFTKAKRPAAHFVNNPRFDLLPFPSSILSSWQHILHLNLMSEMNHK